MHHFHLKDIKTTAPKGLKKSKIIKENEKLIAEIQSDQYKLYAESKRSVLIILQGMDASGKDGVVRYIFSGMNPLGTRACGFRVPTKEESSHDFLWRIHKQAPAKGMVQIFNRSHYEDILVPTVEKYLSKEEIEKRYEQINNFEKMLEDNGTIILKFYLHVSKSKQKEKLNERLTDPTKYRKHNIGDRQTRDEYDKYVEVYQTIFQDCNHPEWHIIPSDQNRYKINCIAKILHKTFKDMNLKWPKLSEDQETALLRAKAELEETKEEDKKDKKEIKLDKDEFEKEVEKELQKELKKLKAKEKKVKAEKLKKEKKKKIKEEKKKKKAIKDKKKITGKDKKLKKPVTKTHKKPVSALVIKKTTNKPTTTSNTAKKTITVAKSNQQTMIKKAPTKTVKKTITPSKEKKQHNNSEEVAKISFLGI